jgi:hypothetical protein
VFVEMVIALEPSNVVPDAAPEFELLNVTALLTLVAVAALPPILNEPAVPVNPVPAPVNDVEDSTPVDGLNVSFVDVVFTGRLPVLAVTHAGYIVALVAVSSVIPTFVALVAVPEIEMPHVPDAFVPVVDGAPIVLYDTVTADEPLNVEPDAAPAPPLLNVTAFATEPA